MRSDLENLEILADSVLERRVVEWDALKSTAPPAVWRVIRELRTIAAIAGIHRRVAAAFDADAEAPAPGTWGTLRILERVGRGRFGDVYRAWEPSLDREVALKLLRRRDNRADEEDLVIEEGRLMARVRHPNVVAIHGAQRINGCTGLWMEFIRGRTLEAELRECGPFSAEDVVEVGIQLCRALDAVHGAGLVHRDVKAQNVMRDTGNRIVLGDFGTGRELDEEDAGEIAGTPAYLPPEIFKGAPPTHRSDLYSLGTLLFHLATNRYPVPGRSLTELRDAHQNTRRTPLRILRPDFPDHLVQIIEKALDNDPSRRFESAAAMGAALTNGKPVQRYGYPSIATRRVAIAAVILILIFAGMNWARRHTPSPSRSGAEGAALAQPAQAVRQIWSGAGVDASGSISPDGRYLSFTDWDTGDLALRDFVTGTSRRLTATGGWATSGDYAGESVISSDGKQVAYGWCLEKELKCELRTVSLSTGRPAVPRVLLSLDSTEYMTPFAWSPDSVEVYVLRNVSNANQIGTVSILDGSFRSIKSFPGLRPTRLSLSNDGRYIAYDAPAGDNTSPRDIFILATGSGETGSVRGPSSDSSPIWSPDDSQMLFLTDRTGSPSLWTASMENGRPKGPPVIVKSDVRPSRLLGVTDKGTLYYSVSGQNRRNVYVAEWDGTRATNAPVHATESFIGVNVGPSWSPDGARLAYYSFRPEPVLVVRDAKTGGEQITPLPTGTVSPFFSGPKWFPDNRSLLILKRDAVGLGFGFYRLVINGGEALLLAHLNQGVSSFDLAPDGSAIYYIFQHPISGRLMRFDISSRREVELKRDEWFITLAVSPDGAQLAYVKSIRSDALRESAQHPSAIDVMPAAGGKSRQVFRTAIWFTGSRYNALTWTPDQRALLFVQDDGALWSVPATGGKPDQVGIVMPARIKSPDVHPDGRRIVFGAVESDDNEIWALESFLDHRK